MGYAFWQSFGPALFLYLLSAKTQGIFRREYLRFYLICGLIGIAIPNTNMYFAAPHLPAGILAVIVNTVPVWTFLAAWALGEESPSWWRFLGVIACFLGIMIMVIPEAVLPSMHQIPWVLATLMSPLCFALAAVYSSRFRPQGCDSKVLAMGMLIASTVILTPLIFATGHFYPLWPPFHLRDGAIILEIILSSIGYVLFFKLIKIAGAIYYSLVAGIVALTGLFWGWVLFGETLTVLSACAVLLIITGIVIVSRFRQ